MHTLRSRLAPLSPLLTGPLLLVTAESNAFPNVVIDWNCTLTSYCASLGPDELSAAVEARVLAIVHLTMLDAVRAALEVTPQENFAVSACAEVAAAQAAHDVLAAVWPAGERTFAAQLASDLREIDAKDLHQLGQAIGTDAARPRIIELGLAGGAPLRLNRLAGETAVAETRWLALPPLALRRRDQFRAGHPATDDAVFAVQRFKRCRSVKALLDPKGESAAAWPQLARFWRETAAQRWNRAARELTVGDTGDVLAHARLFATLNMAMVDAAIAASESRRYYQSPHARLQAGEHMYQMLGGYPALVKASTPAVPDFPSGFAAECGAAAAVLTVYFRDGARAFTLTAASVAPGDFSPPAPRTYRRISDAAMEGALAGMFAGRDFKEACTLGYDLGWRVGRWIAKRTKFAASL